MNGAFENKRLVGIAFMAGVFLGPAMAQSAADQNFQTRCNAPGVLKCIGFDSRSATDMPGRAGNATVDTETKVSGAGSMFVDIPPSAPAAPGHINTSLGKDFGEGSSLYLQWRQRFSPAMVDGNLGGEGFKQFVLYNQTPGGKVEVAMLNMNHRGFPIFYTAMGAQYMRKSMNGVTAQMWNEDEVICTQNDVSGCLRYHPNEWMTFYYEQHIGNWGQANSTVKVYMAREGKPLQQFIHYDKEWRFDRDDATSAYRQIWLGPYSMGRSGGGHPAASTWIDEFIISTQPIADPNQGTTGVRNLAHEKSELDIQTNLFDARVRISFPNPDRHAEVRIHDMQGRKVKAFSGVKDHAVEWDAAGMRNGVYLIQVSAGNRSYARKASLLK